MADRREFSVGGKPLSSLRVVDLKVELEKRGLPKSGSKKDLLERLRLHLQLEENREAALQDEEHVPNLSLCNETENDFIREYLAAQQARFQVQREAKKQFEEQQRESEASAEETTQDEDETSGLSPAKRSPRKALRSRRKTKDESTPQGNKSTGEFQTPDSLPYSTPPQEKRDDDIMGQGEDPSEEEDFKNSSTPLARKHKLLKYVQDPSLKKMDERHRSLEGADVIPVVVLERLSDEVTGNKSEKPDISSASPTLRSRKLRRSVVEAEVDKKEEVVVKNKVDEVDLKKNQCILGNSHSDKGNNQQNLAEEKKHESNSDGFLDKGSSEPIGEEKQPQDLDTTFPEEEVQPPSVKSVEENQATVQISENETTGEVVAEEKQSVDQTDVTVQPVLDIITPEVDTKDASSGSAKKELEGMEDTSESVTANIVETVLADEEPKETMEIKTVSTVEAMEQKDTMIEVPDKEKFVTAEWSPLETPEEDDAVAAAVSSSIVALEEDRSNSCTELAPSDRAEETGAASLAVPELEDSSCVEIDESVLPTLPAIQEQDETTTISVSVEHEQPSIETNEGEKEHVSSPQLEAVDQEAESADTAPLPNASASEEAAPATIPSLPSKSLELEESEAEQEVDSELQISENTMEQQDDTFAMMTEEQEVVLGKPEEAPVETKQSDEGEDVVLQVESDEAVEMKDEPDEKTEKAPSPSRSGSRSQSPSSRSSSCDRAGQDAQDETTRVEPLNEIEIPKVFPLRKLKLRMNRTESVGEEGQGDIGNGVVRKRRWGTSQLLPNKKPCLVISTDSLKAIVPDARPLSAEEVRLGSPDFKPKAPRTDTAIKETQQIPQPDSKTEPLRRIAVEVAEVTAAKPEAVLAAAAPLLDVGSPAQNPRSCVVVVSNLVRPFTLNQLKELLARTGHLIEGRFWIDKVKSSCLVQYETEEEAEETRAALHGIHWPISNPKTLKVDYSTIEDLDKRLAGRETAATAPVSENPPMAPVKAAAAAASVQPVEGRKLDKIREWDLAKLGESVPGEKEFLKEDVKLKDEQPSPQQETKAKDETPAKLLDDLFRKTKTTPCIYWLPLTAQQIAEKEELRRQRLAEREQRVKEIQQRRDEDLQQRQRERERERENERQRARERQRQRKRSRSSSSNSSSSSSSSASSSRNPSKRRASPIRKR